MGKVYESLKDVVKLQRSKNDPVALAGVKHTHVSSLDEEINELAQKINGLKVAVKHHEEVIRKDTQQVIQTLSEDFAILETSRVLKNAVHPSTKLRTNGVGAEIIGEFPFVLRVSKHEFLFSAPC